MNIFDKINELKLKPNSYVVVGGAVLVALGLLDWDEDIDICVTAEVFKFFETQGWQIDSWNDKKVLKKDVYDVGIDFGSWSLQDLQSDALMIKGIPFISLTKLLTWKRDMGRDKDLIHIDLIEKYLETQDSAL